MGQSPYGAGVPIVSVDRKSFILGGCDGPWYRRSVLRCLNDGAQVAFLVTVASIAGCNPGLWYGYSFGWAGYHVSGTLIDGATGNPLGGATVEMSLDTHDGDVR